MVRFQEIAKYWMSSGVDFGPVDVVKYAEAFGATGLKIQKPEDHRLLESLHPNALN
jgi:acetolactate synthase-1/2/3 large subunit